MKTVAHVVAPVVTALGIAFAASACTERPSVMSTPPSAEFLVAAGDSTYWVRSGPTGIRVRSAPILLTEADGEFFEIYVIEDGVDYDDATFGSARVYSHRVLGSDSLLLLGDSTVLRQAARWKRRHPRDEPIDPDSDEPLQDPGTIVVEEIEIVDVHGPWLTFTRSLNVDIETGEAHQHSAQRGVVDVRTGRRVPLDALFGGLEAQRVIGAARASLDRLLDSIRTAGGNRAELARETLATFRFDSTSFAIADVSRAPAVAFMIPGRNADGEALALYLPPVSVAPPPWWKGVRPTLPSWTRDSAQVHWEHENYRVFARATPDGESMGLVLQARAPGDRPMDSAGKAVDVGTLPSPASREWPIATVAAPAYGLITLDARLDAATRSALARAFDLSSALDGLAQRAVFLQSSRPAARRHAR